LKLVGESLTQSDDSSVPSPDYMQKSGLGPIIDDKAEVLILGTLPSDVSLAKGQYYANPANDFWKLIGHVFNQNVVTLSYERRVETLRAPAPTVFTELWTLFNMLDFAR
jgi:hypoxanthine-DNA glycosylase